MSHVDILGDGDTPQAEGQPVQRPCDASTFGLM